MIFSPPRRLLSLLPVTIAALVLGISGFFSAQSVTVSADDPIQCETELLTSSGSVTNLLAELEDHSALSEAFYDDLLVLSGAIADVEAYVAAYNEAVANHTSTSAIVTSLQAAINTMTGISLTVSGASAEVMESSDNMTGIIEATLEDTEATVLCFEPETVFVGSGSQVNLQLSPWISTGAIAGNDCPAKWARYQQALSNLKILRMWLEKVEFELFAIDIKLSVLNTNIRTWEEILVLSLQGNPPYINGNAEIIERLTKWNNEKLQLEQNRLIYLAAKRGLLRLIAEWELLQKSRYLDWADACVKPTYNNT